MVVARPATAKAAWTLLTDIVKDNKKTCTSALKAELRSIKLGTLSLEAYFQKINSLVTILTSLGSSVNDEDLVHYAIDGLPKKYNQVCGYMHYQDTFPDLKTVCSLLITEEMRLKSKADTLLMDSSSPMALMTDSGNSRRSFSTSQVKPWKPCFNFAKGTCRFGDGCRFLHDANMKNTNTHGLAAKASPTDDLLAKILERLNVTNKVHEPSQNTSNTNRTLLVQQPNPSAYFATPSLGPYNYTPAHYSSPGHVAGPPSGFGFTSSGPGHSPHLMTAQQTFTPVQPTNGYPHFAPAQQLAHAHPVVSSTYASAQQTPRSTAIPAGVIGPTTAPEQATMLPNAFTIGTLHDPATGAWNMDAGVSSHLNSSVTSLNDIFNTCMYSSISVDDGHSTTRHSILPNPTKSLHLNNVLITPHIVKNLIYVCQFVRDNNCTIEFDAFGFSVKDFITRRVPLRCDSTGDLYLVITPSPSCGG
ncbi:ribonuclease H-like domain-containing protein [Tanacetum coccineum]|uniref:Ribonuclease H-like domain-containing protein n=1 Tax=Tanacetum coccineum TaxID=301880 RepID=A0ABQ5AMU7_9ASTR